LIDGPAVRVHDFADGAGRGAGVTFAGAVDGASKSSRAPTDGGFQAAERG